MHPTVCTKIGIVVVVVVVVCFYLYPKEQLIIIQDKIEGRLQIGRRQLNDMRLNMHKKIVYAYPTRAL